MRKIAILCRKLKRTTGRAYCVKASARGRYIVYLFDSLAHDWAFVSVFSSVNGVVSYLNAKFL